MCTGAVSRYKFEPEPEICHGAEFGLRADAGVRVYHQLQICLGSRSKSKNRDKQITFIVRVSTSILFDLLSV